MLTLTLINGMGSRSKIQPPVQEPASSTKDSSISISPIKPINLIENTTSSERKTVAQKKSTKQSSKKTKEPIKRKKKV